MTKAAHWTYKLYVMLLLGRINGAERRGTRVFIHMPTATRYLSINPTRIRKYITDGVDLALFTNLKKRQRIWSFDITMPPPDEDRL
jgi:hypothetical protein